MNPADPNRSSTRRQHSSPPPAGNGSADSSSAEAIAVAIRAALAARRPGASLCPSEIARALAPQEGAWRALMPVIRAVAARLAAAGELRVTQRGRPVDALAARGPIRLSRSPAGSGPGDRATPG
ncbi:MAG: DUF3253 domain-containing protein [Geminicoccaceae bacterium]|nr:DUF3253 domain-containing protein [Geminicoccaceae bacterium]